MKKCILYFPLLLLLTSTSHAYYQVEQGRWLNRDRIAEHGGMNLYGFVDNKSLTAVDLHGLALIGGTKPEGDADTTVCQVTYIIGHGGNAGAGGKKFREIHNKYTDACSRTSFNGCNSIGSFGDRGIEDFVETPKDYIGAGDPEKNEPYCNNGGFNPATDFTEANQWQGFAALVQHNWDLTMKQAESLAEDCKCDCSEVTAKFMCEEPFTLINLSRIRKNYGVAFPLCGGEVEYECKKNKKN